MKFQRVRTSNIIIKKVLDISNRFFSFYEDYAITSTSGETQEPLPTSHRSYPPHNNTCIDMANNTTAANESSFELHCACKPPPSIEACLLHHDGHQKGKDRRPYEKFLILDGGILKICRDIKCKPENFFGT